MTLERIQTLWIGPRLSVMEQLALRSFVHHGHEVELYTYDEVANIPEGVTVRDGNEILPSSMIFQYREHQSYSGFSNFFRYRLLLERGGCWVDTDLVALRPIAFADDHVFSSEEAKGITHVNAGFIKAPAGSPAMQRAWDVCASKDRSQIRWGETGPALLREVVETLGMNAYVRPPQVFCPIPFWKWQSLLDETTPELPTDAAAIHLWNELWRRDGKDKDAEFDPRCIYEQLKARYLSRTETTSV
jgi:mannosyltransferase OCH1-like enzyme